VGAGASVAICGRSPARARALARRLGAEAVPWERRASLPWDVLVQATPLGRLGEEVLPAAALTGRVVVDAAYRLPGPTPLAAAAAARGLAVADGVALLLAQAAPQFRHLTGREIAPEVLAAAVEMPQTLRGPA
jgi:shikimate dehydrogenase